MPNVEFISNHILCHRLKKEEEYNDYEKKSIIFNEQYVKDRIILESPFSVCLCPKSILKIGHTDSIANQEFKRGEWWLMAYTVHVCGTIVRNKSKQENSKINIKTTKYRHIIELGPIEKCAQVDLSENVLRPKP